MDQINMQEATDHDRRRFFGAAALTFTAAKLGFVGAARAETNPAPLSVIKSGTNTSFGPLKQIDAGVLNVGYAELGPPNGSPVFLLHGWPYDIHDHRSCANPRRARLSGNRPAFARTRIHPLSRHRHASLRSASGDRRRSGRLDGRP
jgi:hypothetical protein